MKYSDELSAEDRLFAAHINDMAEYASEKYKERFSAFLDGRQKAIALSVLGGIGFENYMFYGGFENAERTVLGVFPPFSECDASAFPIKCLSFSYRKEDRLSHRDFLGSFTACGVDRSMIGDIIVNDGHTAAFVCSPVAGALLSDIKKIGRTGVKAEETQKADITVKRSFEEITGTVSSMRADCVISLAIRQSRAKTAEIIRSGAAAVNYFPDVSVSDEIKCGDVFSVRGFGKFILSSIDGKSKKDKFRICIKKYI